MNSIVKILRDINKLIIDTGLSIKYTLWKVGSTKVEETVDVLFPDGIISINSLAQAVVSKFDAENKATLVNYSTDLITKYSLVDNDLFIGRDSNYLLFRDGSLSIATSELNLDCDDVAINVTNAITVNGIALTFVADKMLINGKEVAVVGGDIDPSTNKISISGQ